MTNTLDSCITEKLKLKEEKMKQGVTLFQNWKNDILSNTRIRTLRSSMYYDFALSYIDEELKEEMKTIFKRVWQQKINDGTLKRKGSSASFTFVPLET